MFSSGYVIYQAERPLARAEQRAADAQLGRCCAALAQWGRSLARPARALRRQRDVSPAGARARVPVDCELAVRTGR
jgi:hypothetical protein